eukprot:35396_1
MSFNALISSILVGIAAAGRTGLGRKGRMRVMSTSLPPTLTPGTAAPTPDTTKEPSSTPTSSPTSSPTAVNCPDELYPVCCYNSDTSEFKEYTNECHATRNNWEEAQCHVCNYKQCDFDTLCTDSDVSQEEAHSIANPICCESTELSSEDLVIKEHQNWCSAKCEEGTNRNYLTRDCQELTDEESQEVCCWEQTSSLFNVFTSSCDLRRYNAYQSAFGGEGGTEYSESECDTGCDCDALCADQPELELCCGVGVEYVQYSSRCAVDCDLQPQNIWYDCSEDLTNCQP